LVLNNTTLAVLLPLCTLVLLGSIHEAEAVEFFDISGTITNSIGDPISANVHLTQNNPAGPTSQTTTNANGEYSFNKFIAAQYRMEITGSNFGYGKIFTITEDTVLDLVIPVVTLSGTVRDSNGQPVQGVFLDAIGIPTQASGFLGQQVFGVDTTDANGFYSIEWIPSTRNDMRVIPPPSHGNLFILNVPDIASDTTFDITLTPNNFCPDHYFGYEASTTRGIPMFSKTTVTLDDQFESGTYQVEKTVRLYNPVNKNSEGIIDELTHLKGYKIKPFSNSVVVLQSSTTGIEVSNQFGTLVVGTLKTELLLVPTAKDPDNPVDELSSTLVDHYKCYKVRVIDDQQIREAVSLEDQFQAGMFDPKRPKMLCNPVDKNGEGVNNPDNHLMCYEINNIFRKTNIHTHDQFGPETLDIKKVKELCVPSKKRILQ